MKNGDASTFIHETGHEWLDRMLRDADDPQAPADLKADADTVLKWLGADSADAVKTKHHEQFARGFETYLMEGRAPSPALATVFAKFKDWLTTIYRTVSALKSPISNDIRSVFDRLLATNPEQPIGEAHGPLLGKITPEESAVDVANRLYAERGRTGTPVGESAGGAPGGASPADEAGRIGVAERPVEPVRNIAADGNQIATEGAGVHQEAPEPVVKGPAAQPEKQRSLLSYLASRGGIRNDDGNIGDLRNSIGANNKFIPGLGQLIRKPAQLSTAAIKSGRGAPMALDTAREAAIEAGYLPEDTTLPQFLDALDRELRGERIYPRGYTPEGRPVDPAELEHFEHSFIEQINDIVKEGGGPELTEKERARAFELWRREGINDPHQIVERLAVESQDGELGAAAREHPIPYWDGELPSDGEPTSAAGLGFEESESAEPRGATARAGGEAQEPVLATDPLPRSETKLLDKAGNIRLDNLGTPEDVNAVIRQVADENAGFIGARRGVVSDAQVLDLADALGMDAGQLNTRKIGQAFNAEQIIAARKLLIQSAMTVRDLAAKVANGAPADVVAYAEARARHMMIQEQVSGITAEAGRALRAFRDLGGDHIAEAHQVTDFLKTSTGKTLYQLEEEAKLLALMGDTRQVSKAIHDLNPTVWQKTRAGILAWFINNLISGPITHLGYMVGNTVTQLYKATVETSAAAALGAIRNAPPGERVYFGEVGAQLYAMVRGTRDGFTPAVNALKTGVSVMKGDPESLAPLGEAALRPQAIPGRIGYVMETPSRAVAAIHTLSYGMNYEAEIARRAFRDAMAKGLDPSTDAFNNSVAEFTQSPPKADMEAAHAEALSMVLMKSPQFGTAAYHLQKAVNNNILAKIVMPFMQIGTNILSRGYVERTPLAVMSQTARDNLAGRNGAIARDTQIAKVGVGIGLAGTVVGLTAENILTGGGPSDQHKRALLEATGWKPYSIRIGEYYVPYRKYLGFLGPLIAGVSDMYEVGHALSQEGLGNAALSSVMGLAEVIGDESWMRGLANFIDAARHWDRDGEKYLRNLSMDFLPFSVGMQQMATVTDPYRREVHSMLDAARAHIPWASQGLHPQRDIWGEPIPSHTTLGPSQANRNPATQALLDAGVYPAKIERKIVGVQLNDQQYDDLARTAGRTARMFVNNTISIPGFNQFPLERRQEMLKNDIENARHMALELIKMQNYFSIVQPSMEAKRAKLTGEKPTVH